MTIKGKAYIAGIYEHPTRHAPDKSTAQLHAEVAKGAIEDAGLTNRVVLAMRQRGVLTRGLVDGSLQVSPPFVVEESDLKLLADVGLVGYPNAGWAKAVFDDSRVAATRSRLPSSVSE